jgi:long-subunit acyl-CoA synthetase (AMP-forming)
LKKYSGSKTGQDNDQYPGRRSETAAATTRQSVAEELAVTGSVTVMEFEQLARSLEPFVARRIASPDDRACIVYISGSTGRPKGVANSHRSLLRRIDVRYPLFGLGRGDRYANLRSQCRLGWHQHHLVVASFRGMPVSV